MFYFYKSQTFYDEHKINRTKTKINIRTNYKSNQIKKKLLTD